MMTLFAALVVLMLAIALAFVLWPLLAKSRTGGAGRDDLNVALYKDRLAELELERDDGSLSDTEFEQARSELQRDLLVNVAPEPENRGGTEGGGWLPWALGVMVPVAALGLYLPLGSTELIGAQAPESQQGESGMPDVEQALVQLRQRVRQNPENIADWKMLGRTLNALRRYREAADVYAQAMRAVGDEAELLLGRAQALALAEGNRLSGEPIELVRRVLAREANHPEALWLSGLHAFEQGDYRKALDRWQQVKAQLESGGELSGTVDSAIAEARARLDSDTSGDANAAPAASTAGIQVEVVVAPGLSEGIRPEDTLFIFARVPGTRMPVVAERRQAADLPLSILLTDEGSMADQPLSDFEVLEVVARISKSGSVSANPGDLEGAQKTAPGDPVTVTIDRVVP